MAENNIRDEADNKDVKSSPAPEQGSPGGLFRIVAQPKPTPEPGSGGGGSSDDLLKLNLKPEELEAYLEAFVVCQKEAKAVLSTKVSTHFNRIRYMKEAQAGEAPSAVGMIKNNILLIGPTGVGKTYLVKLIANKLGVPFVKADATKFSETGYVGGDVEDLVRDLVHAAGDDIELAQCGIIYIDEVDKIASSQSLIGPDVSRSGVQRALLKPMEETEVDLKVPHDPISQLQAIESYRKTGKREKRTVNTKNIMFIMSGAFVGLEDVVKRRLKRQSIGFGAPSEPDRSYYLSQISSEDLISYGFETEFVGRLPVVVLLEELCAEDLLNILRNPNNPIIISKKRDFASYGIELRFEEEALELIAESAAEVKTGARALVGAIERVLLPFEKKLPSTDIKRLLVTPEMVADPEGVLARVMENPMEERLGARFEAAGDLEAERLSESLRLRAGEIKAETGLTVSDDLVDLVLALYDKTGLDVDLALRKIKRQYKEIRGFENRLAEEGLLATFDDEAVYTILRVAMRAEMSPLDYLKGLQPELVPGLQLVRDKTGLDEFILTREAVLNTSEYVRGLVSTRLPVGV